MAEFVTMAAAFTPTRDEFAVGNMARFDPDLAGPPPATHSSPRAALEAVLSEVLAGLPCFVLFSGGRDSSMLLALAVAVARREGLPLPVPVTHRYPGDVQSDEREHQEAVIAHLGLEDWVRVDCTGRHELLGTVARSALFRHGAQLPALWWTIRLPEVVGGAALPGDELVVRRPPIATLITGHAGDELFSGGPQPTVDRLVRGDLRALRHPRRLAREVGRVRRPASARAADGVERYRQALSWIRAPYREALARQQAERDASYPLRYDRYLDALSRNRAIRATQDRNAVAAAESGAQLVEPFLDGRVIAALMRRYGSAFPTTRTDAVRELCGDLLPASIVERTSKAFGDTAFLAEESRAWLQSWDGSGPDEEVIDGLEARRLLLLSSEGSDEGDGRPASVAQRAMLAQLRGAAGS